MALEETRFTLGGLNPNDVATFVVVLALSLPVVLRWSRYWAWFVLPAETILIALLTGTGSRGGVLALLCGAAIGLGWAKHPRIGPQGWRAWAAMAFAILLGIGFGLAAFPKGFRLASVDLSPDASAGRRLEVWSRVPEMLATAPNGWGSGNAAEVYEQWFEPIGENILLKHLLSSHLSWLVEFGWLLRWGYLFLWMGALALLSPTRSFQFSSWGLAVCTAFGIALFYNASGKWWNWPLPILWLVVALVMRIRQRSWLKWQSWMAFAVLAGIFDVLPSVFFRIYPSSMPVRAFDGGNIVVIGQGKPMAAILSPNKDVLGAFYGQEIRREWLNKFNNAGSIIVVIDPSSASGRLLSDCPLVVIAGGNETTLQKWRSNFITRIQSKLVLINCRIPVNDWSETFRQIVYCQGDFYGDQNYQSWKAFSVTNPAVSVKDIPGCEAYIPGWWSLLEFTEK